MENKDVTPGSSPANSEVVKPQTDPVAALPSAPIVTTDKPTPGSQTPSENLLAALKEEREKRKGLEDKMAILEDKLNNQTIVPSEDLSDEAKALNAKINSLEDKIERKELEDKFPQLKELSAEFEEFRKEYPRTKGENVAKLFLQEKGLLEPTRKGLEKPTGGTRTPTAPEMTHDDIKHLRETNYKKYKDMLIKGLIKV